MVRMSFIFLILSYSGTSGLIRLIVVALINHNRADYHQCCPKCEDSQPIPEPNSTDEGRKDNRCVIGERDKSGSVLSRDAKVDDKRETFTLDDKQQRRGIEDDQGPFIRCSECDAADQSEDCHGNGLNRISATRC